MEALTCTQTSCSEVEKVEGGVLIFGDRTDLKGAWYSCVVIAPKLAKTVSDPLRCDLYFVNDVKNWDSLKTNIHFQACLVTSRRGIYLGHKVHVISRVNRTYVRDDENSFCCCPMDIDKNLFMAAKFVAPAMTFIARNAFYTARMPWLLAVIRTALVSMRQTLKQRFCAADWRNIWRKQTKTWFSTDVLVRYPDVPSCLRTLMPSWDV